MHLEGVRELHTHTLELETSSESITRLDRHLQTPQTASDLPGLFGIQGRPVRLVDHDRLQDGKRPSPGRGEADRLRARMRSWHQDTAAGKTLHDA